ncbi:hypothetical protein GOP47_0001561 [Adiantum capillus-veneris]|uniref:Uncharacterized protein n=1 Tax=Adiantum capillus-veneris TaxID=13818 RepID=A0A9D4ZN65_ADICA|nr:hypothetical protein GOP47_0001561 [Adiantum capillus-veneris]
MGSEGPAPGCVIHVTGFKKFHGVDENPTEVLALSLETYIEKRGLPQGTKLGSVNVLETAGDGALATLRNLLDSSISFKHKESLNADPCDQVIWVHMGVNSGANKFAIERKAVNEATFRCPDEMGWQPQRLPIVSEDGGISFVREMMPGVLSAIIKIDTEKQIEFMASLFDMLSSVC